MVKIKKKSKIFMVCPPKIKTGGPELAHQLVNNLTQNDVDAYMYYIGAENDDDPVNQEFKKYKNKYVTRLGADDVNENNVLILPETYTYLAREYNDKMQVVIWWMSVDNYIYTLKVHNVKDLIKKIIHYKQPYRFEKRINCMHLCQSYYAINYIKQKKIKDENINYLSDYISDNYLNVCFDVEKKEDIVLYNPKKGKEFTERIINYCKNVRFIPIKNMTTEEVQQILLKAKIYIDFGNHPGKDRFPREAAMCGCCVITGKRGSAKFYDDVPIDEKYKFEDKKESISEISKQINDILEHYDKYYNDFNTYRSWIKGEKEQFSKDVKKIFVKAE